MVNKTDVIFALVGHAVCVHVFMMGIGTRDMAIHSNILAWKIPWTEEPGR